MMTFFRLLGYVLRIHVDIYRDQKVSSEWWMDVRWLGLRRQYVRTIHSDNWYRVDGSDKVTKLFLWAVILEIMLSIHKGEKDALDVVRRRAQWQQ